MKKRDLQKFFKVVSKNPAAYLEHEIFGELARALNGRTVEQLCHYEPREHVPFCQWGQDLDKESIEQMRNACSLPISVRGALMPDAHVGYGLPIGGVLATRNAVVPYAVGVDIACRMKLSVLDLPLKTLTEDPERFKRAIESQTRFGIGAEFSKHRRQHAVMDRDWSVSPITKAMKDRAWAQLGTSGSGNHFVEFGVLEIDDSSLGLAKGQYLALLSHSGSRGTGAKICDHYSRMAMGQHPELPPFLKRLAWLKLDSAEGREYWAAMSLMGEYAAANHACIHRHVAQHLDVPVLLDVENHHNFAWKELHDGEEVVVHRKGATPAGAGVLGVIPGTMATPGYVVRGRGNSDSLASAAHGAGRVMSRTQARKTIKWKDAHEFLRRQGVTVISADLDEMPMVYKNIHSVMSAQADLVETLATFHPRLVKMAPAGNRGED